MNAIGWTGWAQLGLLVTAIIAAAVIIRTGRSEEAEWAPKKLFAKFVRQAVEKRSSELNSVLTSKLSDTAHTGADAQEFLRGLRRDMRASMALIERLDKRAPESWPTLDLHESFYDWAEPVRATDRAFEDMLDDLRSGTNRRSDADLIDEYKRREWLIRRSLEGIEKRSAAVIKAAKEIEDKK